MAAYQQILGVWRVTDIKDVLLTDILPDIFLDAAKTKAFALAERSVRREIYEYVLRTMIYHNLSQLDDKVLNQLAVEMKTQYYSSSLDHDTRVRLIANTIRWHVLAGTRTSVEELIKTVFKKSDVLEWFEYSGLPFYFRIITDTDLSQENVEMFRDMIKKVKNPAIMIENISVLVNLLNDPKVSGGVIVEECVSIASKKEEINFG